MEAAQYPLYPFDVSLHRIKKNWGGWPGKVGEIWSLSGPPYESLVLNGPLAGRWLTEIVGDFQQKVLGQGVELDPREPFPFLIKFISTAKDAPVQVHPDDAYTVRKRLPTVGLDKVWYILDAKPGGLVYLGFTDHINPAQIMEAVQQKSIHKMMNAIPVKRGDLYTVPAGRIHAIGKGIRLMEVRRHSDVTYQVLDWAREETGGDESGPLPDEALEVLSLEPVSPRTIPQISVGSGENRLEYLACTPRFLLRRLMIKDTLEISHAGRRMLVYTGVKGSGWLRWGFSDFYSYIQPYQSILVPAVPQELYFETGGGLEVVETSVPDIAGETLNEMLELGIPKERIILLGGDDYKSILRGCLLSS